MDVASVNVLSNIGCCFLTLLLNKIKNFGCRNFYGLLMPIGKSHLSKLLNDNPNVIILDIENKIQKLNQSKELEISEFPTFKNFFQEFKQSFKRSKILVLSSNYNLLKYIGIRRDKIMCYVPSESFLNEVLLEYEGDKELFKLNRIKLISKFGNTEKMIYYNSFTELEQIIKLEYNIKNKL